MHAYRGYIRTIMLATSQMSLANNPDCKYPLEFSMLKEQMKAQLL